jgi:OmpA-OmpF porin, OOP family
MKNRSMFRTTAVMAFLIVCFCASGALAENREGAINITPFIGGFNIDGDLPYDDGPALGIGLGYNFSEKLGAEFTFHYVSTDYNGNVVIHGNSIDWGKGDAKAMIYKLDLLYHLTGLLPGDMIVPYLAAGPGMITLDPDRKDVDSQNDFLLNYGGGLKIFLTRNLALRGDVRNVVNFHGGDRYSNLLYTAGLTYEIGGKEREEVKEEAPAPEPEPVPAPAPAVTPPPPPPAPAAKEQGAIIFRNINFDFNKATIKSESEPILDEVAAYLKANPNVKMEIQGHTDSKGTAAYNLKLSDKRAAAVKAYLIKDEAIKADRLETKGFGLSKPIAPNDTEENRARNRRVEFKPIQ